MEELNLRLTFIGLGLEAVAIGLLQSGELPEWVPWLVVAIGLGVIAYGISPFSVTGVRRLALYLPVSPKKTTTTEQDVTLSARLRWTDAVGKPSVNVADGHIRHIGAALDIEVRNRARHPQRVAELYLEIRHAKTLKLKRLIATVDPVAVDANLEWYSRPFPRRVEWLLEPVSGAIAHYVRFDRGWMPEDEDAPGDPKTFIAVVVAEFGTSSRPIRLQIGEDIWRTGEIPEQRKG